MKSLQIKAKILSQARIKENCWHCELSAGSIAKAAQPGQFINARVSDGYDPLLRRPLSIHGVSGAKVKILYAVVGKATEILSRKKAGEYLDIIGPLGNGFDLGRQKTEDRRQVLVAGGMGVAPLLFLAERLAYSVERIAYSKSSLSAKRYPLNAIILIGAKSKDQLLCVNDFRKLGCEVKIATDDGSSGFKGRISDLLQQLLSTIDYRLSTIYACGPKPMLKAVANISHERAIPAQLSLEEHMACGLGACLGCVVQTKDGLKRVCQDGPVFNRQELAW